MPISGFPCPSEVSEAAMSFQALEGFAEDDHLAAFAAFKASCAAIVEKTAALRPAVAPPPALEALCRKALAEPPADAAEAKRFFETHFTAHRLSGAGFVTGYYEPLVEGSLTPDADFCAPILARPDDLVTLPQGESLEGPDGPLQAALAGPQGLAPYPDRAAIEAGGLGDRARPILWLKDKVEVFFIQVQGSARVRLRDGSERRLTYAGRNGHPYSSIGRILIKDENLTPEQADMAGVKHWIGAHGLAPGEAGAALMLRNKSYVFFSFADARSAVEGPVGGQGLPLTPLRSLALDRGIWPYGLPVWIDATIPDGTGGEEHLARLAIAQDTGSAILGAARMDLFVGSGATAGHRAGLIRHPVSFIVLWPR